MSLSSRCTSYLHATGYEQEHQGVVDIISRRDFSRFDPSLAQGGPTLSQLWSARGAKTFFVTSPSPKKEFGHGEKAWFSSFGPPRGARAVGHFRRYRKVRLFFRCGCSRGSFDSELDRV